jgi:hypothetical protein
MRKHLILFISLTLGLLIISFASLKPVAAQTDFIAYRGNAIADSQIDGVIGNEWNDAAYYKNINIDPWGIALFWIKQDGTNLYIGMKFYADSTNPWVAFQLGPSFCMSTSADGAIFGHDNYSANGYEDISFNEAPGISADDIQDGKGALSVNATYFVVLELKKPLNSGDIAGKDMNWSDSNTYSLVIIWDSDGGGSSGGAANHAVGSGTQNTVLINPNPNPVPEFPSSISIVSLFTLVAVSALIIKKRWRRNADAT